MNHHLHGINWYEKQKKERENMYERSQVSLINRNLQTLLHQVESRIDKNRYELQIDHVNRVLSHCHVWNIGYLNNLESKQVAVEQAVLLTLILHSEKELAGSFHLKRDVERYMRQLGNIDYGLFGEFGRRIQMITRKNVEDNIKRVY